MLLIYPGLLARYDQIQLLEKLRDVCGDRTNKRQGTANRFIIEWAR